MPQALETYSPQTRMVTPVQFPEQARWTAGRFGNSLTLAAGTLVGKKTADSKLYAYNNANADGTETAVGILMYSIDTDASGNVYFGGSATASALNPSRGLTAPYFISGTFDPADLTGSDAPALVDFKASTLASGYVRIP